MIIDFETIFWTIIVCAVLIISINWWLAIKLQSEIVHKFGLLGGVVDKRTETLEEIQEDLRKIKEKLDIY